MDNKEIRFIDSHYNELFRIPDKGVITVTYPDGHKENKLCRQGGYLAYKTCYTRGLSNCAGQITND